MAERANKKDQSSESGKTKKTPAKLAPEDLAEIREVGPGKKSFTFTPREDKGDSDGERESYRKPASRPSDSGEKSNFRERKPKEEKGDDFKPRFKKDGDKKPFEPRKKSFDSGDKEKPARRFGDDEKKRSYSSSDKKPGSDRYSKTDKDYAPKVYRDKPGRDSDVSGDGKGRLTKNEKTFQSKSRGDKPFREPFKSDENSKPERSGYVKKNSEGEESKGRFSEGREFRSKERGSKFGSDSKSGSSEKPAFRGKPSARGGKKEFDKDRKDTRSTGKEGGGEYHSEWMNDVPKDWKHSKPVSKRKKGPTLEETDGKIRLNKYISNSGVCSRREADDLIKSGAVKVNGKIVTEMGFRVSPSDKIQYGDETLNREPKKYLLLNKPKDYITTASDPSGRKTVMDLVSKACKERLYPVGRLDRATTGLLLMTNDGDLAKRLTHPSHGVKKVYHVTLSKNLKAVDMKRIMEGLDLEDGKAMVDDINYVGDGSDKAEIGIELHSGKNRIVRRIFEHLGYEVVKLDRTYFAGLTKKDLPRGHYRFLTEKEVIMLRMS